MENIPQSPRHVSCDFFLDAELVCTRRNQTVFDFNDELQLVQLDSNEALVGTVGRLAVFYTPFGERWQFRPYRFQTWRRMPGLDTALSWTWRCIETGELTTTPIGSVPSYAPTALPRSGDVDDLQF